MLSLKGHLWQEYAAVVWCVCVYVCVYMCMYMCMGSRPDRETGRDGGGSSGIFPTSVRPTGRGPLWRRGRPSPPFFCKGYTPLGNRLPHRECVDQLPRGPWVLAQGVTLSSGLRGVGWPCLGGGRWWAVGKLVRRWTLGLGMPSGLTLRPASVWGGHPRAAWGGAGAAGGRGYLQRKG